jgi:hypothetical protein
MQKSNAAPDISKYIFLDESGELGFKECSSKYFVITLLSCDEGEIYDLRRIMKKVKAPIK